jgi:hypothetical protein
MTKKFIHLSVFCLSLLFSAAIVTAETAVERHGKLKTQGGYILNEHNEIVQLRGMSFYWTTNGWNGTQWYTKGTLDALVDNWKCTVVRLAYDTKDNWNLCQAVLDECIVKGIYVIIDWHSHNANDQEAAAVSFFKEKARQYKGTPNVIFEPFNEPKWAGGATAEVGDVANAVKTWAAIKPYLKNVTKAIRAEGAENLVILGTPYFSQFVGVAADNPVLDDGNKPFTNVAYSYHFYAASHGKEAYYYSHADASGNKSGGMEPSYLTAGLGKVPIFITEWGTTHSDGGEKNSYIDEANTKWWFDNYVDKNHLSHCNWSVSSFQPSSAFSGSATSPSQSGAIVKKYIAVSTVDHWISPADEGKQGPAAELVSTMPGTHAAVRYNRYYDGSITAMKVPYLLKDKKDVRTASDSAVAVAGSAASSEWFSYNIKSSAATKNILVRYLALKGTATLDIQLDNKSIGTVSLTTTPDSLWAYKVVSAAVSAGDHKLKFKITDATGDGFMMEWFELTDSDKVPTSTSNIKIAQRQSNEMNVVKIDNNIILQVPEIKNYSAYSIFRIDGRSVVTAPLTQSSGNLILSNLTVGTWFIRLEGNKGDKTYRFVVNKK